MSIAERLRDATALRQAAPEETVQARKATYRAYRAAAHLAAHLHQGLHVGGVDLKISVPQQAEVQMVEDGAYVEAKIWVPKLALVVREPMLLNVRTRSGDPGEEITK